MKLGSILMDSYVSESFVESSKLVVNTPGLLESMLEFTHESNQVEAKREMYKNLLENIRLDESGQPISENIILGALMGAFIGMVVALITAIFGGKSGSGGGSSVRTKSGLTSNEIDSVQSINKLILEDMLNHIGLTLQYDAMDEYKRISAKLKSIAASKIDTTNDMREIFEKANLLYDVMNDIIGAAAEKANKSIDIDVSDISISGYGIDNIDSIMSLYNNNMVSAFNKINDDLKSIGSCISAFIHGNTSTPVPDEFESVKMTSDFSENYSEKIKSAKEDSVFAGSACIERYGVSSENSKIREHVWNIIMKLRDHTDPSGEFGKSLVAIKNTLQATETNYSKAEEKAKNGENPDTFKKIQAKFAELKSSFAILDGMYKALVNVENKIVYKEYFNTYKVIFQYSKLVNAELKEVYGKDIDESESVDESAKFFDEMEYMIAEARCEQQDSIDKAYISAMLRETNCLASSSSYLDTIQEFNTIHENLGVKIKTTYNNVMAKIKEVFAQFMEKLRGNFTSTKNYMDKYKKTITGSNFVKRQYNTRDIIGGIDRVMNTEVPYLDYAQLQGDLESINKFMTSRMKDMKVANKPFEGASASDVAAFAKDYFNGPEMKLDTTEFQRNINKIYDFLYNIKKIENSINKSIGNIDKVVKSILKTAGADYQAPADAPVAGTDASTSGSGTSTSSTPNQPESLHNSAVYSYLYGKNIFTEAEDVTEPATGTNTSGGTTTSKTAANNITSGDGVDNQAQRNNQKPVVETHAQVYMDVCTAILRAKLTSLEFIRAECMQIIRAHVADYVGKTGSPDGATSPNAQQQSTEQQPAEEVPDTRTRAQKRADAAAEKQKQRRKEKEAKAAAKAAAKGNK